MDKLVPIVVLIILVLIIAIIVVKTLRKNNKTNKENFNVNSMANSEVLNLDNLIDAFKKPSNVSEMVASSSLEEGIKSIKSSINTMNTEIENLKKKEQIPKGSIMLWFKGDIPDNWVICDGATYNVTYENGNIENGIQVPDFIGKFVKGVGSEVSTFNSGGSDKIIAANLPVHSHIVEKKTGLKTDKDGDHKHRLSLDTRKKDLDTISDNDKYWAVLGHDKRYRNGSYANVFDHDYAHSKHSHNISDHTHVITKSIDARKDNTTQTIFEPKYQEAKFIYYLGNVSGTPTKIESKKKLSDILLFTPIKHTIQ